MTTSTAAPISLASSPSRVVVLAAAVAAAAISLVVWGIASLSLALGTPEIVQLTPLAFTTFTVLAGVVGAIGWAVVRRRVRNPRRVLALLAAAALAASFVPLGLLTAAEVGVVGWAPFVTLAIMHVASIGTAVAVFSLLLPVPRTAE